MQSCPVKTTCAYCGVGCGIDAEINDIKNRHITITGQADHPANGGRLCSKGIALGDTVAMEGRLLAPEIKGEAVHWDDAIGEVVRRINQTITDHGPQAVAMYLSGQLLTEDYYIANKLMKGFIGSANVDTNSRLCMSSSVAGHKRAFGADTVPGCYEDLELADLIVLTGSNTAWCHPVIFQRISAAKKRRPGTKIVVIDPRRTATCEIADLHLPLKSGTDGWLFNGLLTHLAQTQCIDEKFIKNSTEGYQSALQAATQSAPNLATVADICGLTENDVKTFFQWFVETTKTVTIYSQGINQSSSGSDKVNAIINCHLFTGRIGKEGMGPLSLTGQPNAMGGREVGGLANQLAAHMDFHEQDIDRVKRFWEAPNIVRAGGLKAVELFEAMARGDIKTLWIMGTNPAVSMPDADNVCKALANCSTVIVSDCIRHTDTTEYADILLPATGWGEKDGTVTNSERCLSRQRALLPPAGEARHDWQIIRDVAIGLGFAKAFNYQSSSDIFREHAALSGFENESKGRLRDFNISGLASLSNEEYQNLQPISWPVTKQAPMGTKRLFSDGFFYTPSGKANFIPIVPRHPEGKLCKEFPLILNTGRIRDQWHTMTRTGLAPQLNQHIAEPYCEIHPGDANESGLEDRSLAIISSKQGSMIARVKVSEEQKAGSIFIPMHWNKQLAGNSNVGMVVNSVTDPVSGQPESKHTPASIASYCANWHGFAFSRQPLKMLNLDYWVKVKGSHFYRYEFADQITLNSRSQWCKQLLNDGNADARLQDWIEYSDECAGKYRAAIFEEGHLIACIFIGPDCNLPDRSWLSRLFNAEDLSRQDRISLLAGHPANPSANAGETICACFGVGANTIRNAITEDKLTSVEAIGDQLNAGTNCGSCIPELEKFLA